MHEETVVEPRTVPEIPKAASDTIVGAFVRAQQAQAALQACVELVRQRSTSTSRNASRLSRAAQRS